MTFLIRALHAGDIPTIAASFAALGWNKPAAQYERYLAEQEAGQRPVFVAFTDHHFAGYLTVCWESGYPPFRAGSIPEIMDFNVLPRFRRQGFGARLMDAAEGVIAQRSPVAGLGVGLTPDYGVAQRLYARRGYIPDGRGLSYHGRIVQHGESVTVDDDLILYMTRPLRV